MLPTLHSFLSKYFLNACYILCTILGCGDLAVSQIDKKSLSLWSLYSGGERLTVNQKNT